MFFSSKEKKAGNSKVLSEAEIKKKLYGEFDNGSSQTHSYSDDFKLASPELETQVPPKRESAPGVTVRPTSFGATSRPESLVSRSFQNKKSVAQTEPSVKKSIDWQKKALQFAQVFGGIVAGVLWKIGSYVVQALEFILKILDPRKPQARKVLYSITACVLVVALFVGVFRLNAQRKKAMLGELPHPAITATVEPKTVPAAAGVLSPAQSTAGAALQEKPANSQAAEPIVTPVVPVPPVGKYVIQVATYAVLDDANHLIESINQAGFTAFYKKQVRNATGHSFYPVYLGRFESSALANQALNKFRRASVARPFQDAFVRTLE